MQLGDGLAGLRRAARGGNAAAGEPAVPALHPAAAAALSGRRVSGRTGRRLVHHRAAQAAGGRFAGSAHRAAGAGLCRRAGRAGDGPVYHRTAGRADRHGAPVRDARGGARHRKRSHPPGVGRHRTGDAAAGARSLPAARDRSLPDHRRRASGADPADGRAGVCTARLSGIRSAYGRPAGGPPACLHQLCLAYAV